MGIFKKLGKVGLGGIAGIVANKGMLPKYSGIGMIQRELGMGKKKKKAAEAAGGMRGRPMMEDIMVDEQVPVGMRARPMVEDIMMAEEAPAGAPMMRKGGKVKKKPMAVKKMAKGGSASRRADGCATKGKTKGKFV